MPTVRHADRARRSARVRSRFSGASREERVRVRAATKIASNTITNAETGITHCETLIQTELGTYFILNEDLLSGEVATRRVTANEAREFRALSNSQAVPT